MFGGRTLVFTRNGFKYLSEINIYDEVLTDNGDFSPVMELGPWEPMDMQVELSTGEIIYCSHDTLWETTVYGRNGSKYQFVDEIVTSDSCIPKLNINRALIRSLDNYYNPYYHAVVVPDYVPAWCLCGDMNMRKMYFAGLVDSPICELTNDKEFAFYTRYEKLAKSIVSLARLCGWVVSWKFFPEDHLIRVSVYTKGNYELPGVRDEYKLEGVKNSNANICVKIVNVCRNRNNKNYKVMGRRIKVDNGGLLVGYSMVSVT